MGDKIYVESGINEEGWFIHLTLDGAGLEIPLDQAQTLIQDMIAELKDIAAIEEDLE